jgi:Phosphodiester glycosidase
MKSIVVAFGSIVSVVGVSSLALAQETPASTTQPADTATTAPATQPVEAVKLPYTLEHFQREGPVAGVVVKVDLTDPRVSVRTALTDPTDPDGPGPAVGRLDTISNAAQRHAFEIAINASFFKVSGSRVVLGKKVGYFVGNGTWPAGWLCVNGKTLSVPAVPRLRQTMTIDKSGKISLQADLPHLPPDTQYAVSGDCKVLTDGTPTPPEKDTARHPRTVIGLSEDGNTLILLSIDGRRPGWSRGTTHAESAMLLKEFGGHDGINLDGGGSSTLVIKDPMTGAYSVANRPSDLVNLIPGLDSVQRPVADMVGVDIKDE